MPSVPLTIRASTPRPASARESSGPWPSTAASRCATARTVTHPGQGNPNILEPAGPTDPEVGVIGVWDDKKKLLGCVVNFACHATTSPGGISANYIYYLEKVIQGYYGKDAVVVFLNGASGDVTQVNNQSPYRYPTGDQLAQLVGGKVGAEALKVLLTMTPGALVPVEARTKVWPIKRRPPSPERVKECLEMVQKEPAKGEQTEWTFAKEIVLLDAKIKKEPAVDVEVQAVQVGPAVFLTTPAEYFCRFGLEQKAKSGFPFTFPVSLANGCVGYVPTEDAFAPSRRRLRNPPDQLQQPGNHSRQPDARRRPGAGRQTQAGRGADPGQTGTVHAAVVLWQREARVEMRSHCHFGRTLHHATSALAERPPPFCENCRQKAGHCG